MAKSEGTNPSLSNRHISELQAILGNPYTPKKVKEEAVAEIRRIEALMGRHPERYNSPRFSRSVSEMARMEEETNG